MHGSPSNKENETDVRIWFWDYPGFVPSGKRTQRVLETFLFGIACKSIKQPNVFLKQLLSAGTLLAEIAWFDSGLGQGTPIVNAGPHLQANDVNVALLLDNGGWLFSLDLVYKGLRGVDSCCDLP
jgi:hypothetical protein